MLYFQINAQTLYCNIQHFN